MKLRMGSAVAAVCLGTATAWAANPLKQATFTQVVNRVEVIKGSQQTAAQVGGVFRSPETLRTGTMARCELKASDDTVTRIGSNTVFRYGQEPRTIDLEQGNVLFYSPNGKGGGTIKTASASAGVLGSTNMVSTTSNGGFKVLSLEHRTKVTFFKLGPFGQTRVLKPGQMTFVLPGARQLPPVFEFRLQNLIQGSELLNGFTQQLPSMPAIMENARVQEQQIAKGKKSATQKLIGDVNEDGQLNLIDGNTRQAFFVGQIEDDVVDPILTDLYLTSPDIPEEFTFIGADVADALKRMGFATGSSSSYTDWGLVAASNIFVQTPAVDLSPFSGLQAVLFAAVNDINIEQSVNFQGYGGTFEIYAFEKVNIASGSTVRFNGEFFVVGSPNSLSFSNVTFANSQGGLLLDSQNGDITMTNGGFDVGGGSYNTPADQFIGLSAPNGTISLTGPGNMAFLDFPVTSISMSARTIILDHVRFPVGSSVYLSSIYGMLAPNPNTGASPLAGYVNFRSGVFYGASPAEYAVSTDNGGLATPGTENIYIGTSP